MTSRTAVVRDGALALGGTRRRLADFLSLTKPRVTVMVLVSTVVGYYVGSPATPITAGSSTSWSARPWRPGARWRSTSSGSATSTRRMARTRPARCPTAAWPPLEALLFGRAHGVAGLAVLAIGVAPAAAAVTAATSCSTSSPTRRSSCARRSARVVGAVPGALPPVTGWAAARGDAGIGAGVLFAHPVPLAAPAHAGHRPPLPRGLRAGRRARPAGGRRRGRLARSARSSAAAWPCCAVSLLPTLVGLAGAVYFSGALVLGAGFLACGAPQALAPPRWPRAACSSPRSSTCRPCWRCWPSTRGKPWSTPGWAAGAGRAVATAELNRRRRSARGDRRRHARRRVVVAWLRICGEPCSSSTPSRPVDAPRGRPRPAGDGRCRPRAGATATGREPAPPAGPGSQRPPGDDVVPRRRGHVLRRPRLGVPACCAWRAPFWPPPLQPRLPIEVTGRQHARAAGLERGRWCAPCGRGRAATGRRSRLARADRACSARCSWPCRATSGCGSSTSGSRSPRGSTGPTFYTLIGIHAAHVLGALVWLALVPAGAARGRFRGPGRARSSACAMYWHFVVALWPVLYVLVYLA